MHEVRRVALEWGGDGVEEIVAGVVAVAHGVEHPKWDDGESENEADGACDDTDGSFGEGSGGIGCGVEGVIESGVDTGLYVGRDAVAVDLEPFVELVASGGDGHGECVDELGDLVDGDWDNLRAGEEEQGGERNVDEDDGESTSVDVALVGACRDDVGHAVDEWGHGVGQHCTDGERDEGTDGLQRDVQDRAEGDQPECDAPSGYSGHRTTMPECSLFDSGLSLSGPWNYGCCRSD